jgi:hypothetical protein
LTHSSVAALAAVLQEMLGIPLLGAIPEDQQVIISTNRGEPLVLQKKLSLSGIAFENAARRLIGKQDYFVDVQVSNTRQLVGSIQTKGSAELGTTHLETATMPVSARQPSNTFKHSSIHATPVTEAHAHNTYFS